MAPKLKVLHYKSNFLNYSETFIKRLIAHHKAFTPAAMCIEKRSFARELPVFEMPCRGYKNWINTAFFHLNKCLPFYDNTIRHYQPDIIHAHFGFDGYRMIKLSQKTSVPLVVSFYGSDVTRLPAEFDWKRRYRKLAKHGNAFIAATTLMKKQLVDLGFPERKITVIRFGLDINKFKLADSYYPDQPIMMAGRMVGKKGFSYALEALAMLNEQGTPFHLDLYGDGPLRKELENQAEKLKIDHLLTFHGKVPPEEIRDAFHRHSVLLVPSVTASDGDQEGLPNILLEGMACGIPVIATDHAAIREVVHHQETGFLIKPGNAKALTEAISSIKNGQLDFESIRGQARLEIEKNYELTRMVHEVEMLYRKVLDSTHSHKINV